MDLMDHCISHVRAEARPDCSGDSMGLLVLVEHEQQPWSNASGLPEEHNRFLLTREILDIFLGGSLGLFLHMLGLAGVSIRV